jgi:dienelactone hydrolase
MKTILANILCIFLITQAHATLNPVSYTDASQKLNGFSGIPAKPLAKKSGVLILPAWKGIDEHSKKSAEDLSAAGYYTFVADIYGEGHYPKDSKEAGKQAGYYKSHISEYQHRIQLALDQLVKAGADANQIVVLGYCFGGTGAIEAARGGLQVKGIVSFHGGLSRDTARVINPITAKVLVLHGADDPFVPVADITAFQNEMRTAKADWQMVYYANAVHAFTDQGAGNDNAKGAAYNPLAAERSWKAMLVFLKEVLSE